MTAAPPAANLAPYNPAFARAAGSMTTLSVRAVAAFWLAWVLAWLLATHL